MENLPTTSLRPIGYLDVYIASHCFACDEARRLAGAAAARFMGLYVRVVDVGLIEAGGGDGTNGRGHELPDGVVAVPAYVLDGQILSLGNPAPEQLFARLAARLAGPRRRGAESVPETGETDPEQQA